MTTDVLVTGCSGFIGEHIVDALVRCGYRVHGIDIKDLLAGQRNHASFQICDIRHRDRLVDLVRGWSPSYVIHLAARTDMEGKTIDEYDANTRGVKNLIEALRETRTVQRCLFTSSQLVCKIGYRPCTDEDYCPNTVYGMSKVVTEKIVRDTNGGGFEWCIVRPTTVWGPGMGPHYRRFLSMIQRGKYFHVGKGPLRKSYGYVTNIAHQYCRLLVADKRLVHGRTVYLADYEPLDLIEWAEAFRAELGARSIPTVPVPVARLFALLGDQLNRISAVDLPFNSFRLNNVLTQYEFDLSDTKRICGPVPITKEDAIRETVAWFLKTQKTDPTA